MFKQSLRSLLLASAIAAASTVSTAWAETVLSISTWGTPNNGINTIVWPTWGKWIEEATEGRVKLEVLYEVGAANSQMDIVADGIADGAWLFHGYYSGRFEATKLVEYPYFVDMTAEDMSKAYWRVHEKHLHKANEHRGVKVMGVSVFGPGTLYTTEAIDGWQDLIGKRIRIAGGVAAEVAKLLQISGVSLPAPSAYEAASQGVIDGIFVTLESLKSYRFAEVFPYIYSVPGGLYRGSSSIVLNPDKWESISEADREAIMAVSGEKLSAMFGAMFDEHDGYGIEYAKENNNTFTDMSPEAVTELRTLVADLPEQWVKNNQNRGFDAKAALAMFKAEIGADN